MIWGGGGPRGAGEGDDGWVRDSRMGWERGRGG